MSKEVLLNPYYTSSSKASWQGRTSTDNSGKYWHEIINIADINKLKKSSYTPYIGLMRYACDEGVQRNQGRIGAAQGPDQIIAQLAKLPVHFTGKTVADFGEIRCPNGDLEGAQSTLAQYTTQRLLNQIFPINIGGGHDIAYATYCGIRDAIEPQKPKSLGIINFDAHFDLRTVENAPNSGTPFYQILTDTSTALRSSYTVIGIQRQSNHKSLFSTAQQLGVSYIENEDCTINHHQLNTIHNLLKPMLIKHDYLYLSIDMDCFSSAFAPGVSAPSSLGIQPLFFLNILRFLLRSPKLIAIDIAETNPTYDLDHSTARLAARIIDTITTSLNLKEP